jgi:hypothetical protein
MDINQNFDYHSDVFKKISIIESLIDFKKFDEVKLFVMLIIKNFPS